MAIAVMQDGKRSDTSDRSVGSMWSAADEVGCSSSAGGDAVASEPVPGSELLAGEQALARHDDDIGALSPQEFSWLGRVHHVQHIFAHDRVHEEVWRVQAVVGRNVQPGVFELRFDWSAGRWSVRRLRLSS